MGIIGLSVRFLLVILALGIASCSLIEDGFEAYTIPVVLDSTPLGLLVNIDEKNRVIDIQNVTRGISFVMSFREDNATMSGLSCSGLPSSIEVLDNGIRVYAPLKGISESITFFCRTKKGKVEFRIAFNPGSMQLISKIKGTRDGNPQIGGPDNSWYLYESASHTLDGFSQIVIQNIHSGEVRLVSQTTNGRPGLRGSYDPKFSKNGRAIIFKSSADNFPGANGKNQIYLKYIGNLSVPPTLVSGLDKTIPAKGNCFKHQFSPDGRSVVFVTAAPNFVNANGKSQVYVKKISDLSKAPLLVSGIDAKIPGTDSSQTPIFSPDGKKIIFSTSAQNFPLSTQKSVPGNQFSPPKSIPLLQVYMKDYTDLSLEPVLVSGLSDTVQGDGDSIEGIFSPDGEKIVFVSNSTNLGTNSSHNQIYVKEVADLSIAPKLISGVSAELAGSGNSGYPIFSPDGSKIFFQSDAASFVGSNGYDQIYVKDYTDLSNAPVLVSGLDNSIGGTGPSGRPYISSNGKTVVFKSSASNFSGASGGNKIYVKDYTAPLNEPVLISPVGSSTAALGPFSSVQFSPDGTKIVFVSSSPDFPGANGLNQIYVKNYKNLADDPVLISGVDATTPGLQDSDNPSFSPDGNKILFLSYASNFINSGNGGNLFVKDYGDLSLPPVLVSGLDATTPLGVGHGTASFSPDGTKIVFESATVLLAATYLGSGNGDFQIFVKDYLDLSLAPVLISGVNTTEAGYGDSTNPRFSPDGNKIVFISKAYEFAGANFLTQIYTKDYQDLSLDPVLVSGSDAISTGNSACDSPRVSPDGNFILYSIVPNSFIDGSGDTQIFMKDTRDLSLAPILVSGADANTPGEGVTGYAQFSPDGKSVVFSSDATNFPMSNGHNQVYIKSLVNLSASPKIISSPYGLVGGYTGSFKPKFSPDGSDVLIVSKSLNFPGANGGTHIYKIKLD